LILSRSGGISRGSDPEEQEMTDVIERTFHRLGEQLPGRVSMPRDDRYAAATAIRAKPVGRPPSAVLLDRAARARKRRASEPG